MTRLSRILIAEDDHTIAHVVQRVLEDTQLYQVKWVTDGDAVLESVATEPPDLILLDLMMPKRNGFEVCRVLQDQPAGRKIPICIMTALTDDKAHQTARDAGADEILMKPFRANGLREVVRRLLPPAVPATLETQDLREFQGEVPSWSHLIGDLRRLCRSLDAELRERELETESIGKFRRLIEQAERRLTDTLAEGQRARELDLRARFRSWSKEAFNGGSFVDELTTGAELNDSYLAEVDSEVLDAFLESLSSDISASLSIRGEARVTARRNGQTLVFRCIGELKGISESQASLSSLSVGLSQLLGASLSLETAAVAFPVLGVGLAV